MCVSRRYVGRAVGVDAFEVSCPQSLASQLCFTARSRRAAQLAAPHADADAAMPQATVNPSGAAAPFDPSTAIAHFQFIEDASAFIQGKHAVVPRAHIFALYHDDEVPTPSAQLKSEPQ